MIFTSNSQAGQDRFVYDVLVEGLGILQGKFLDIGANSPVSINNTYALEQIGWRGLLVDNSPESMAACEAKRKSAFLLTDATMPQDWTGALRMADEINHGASEAPPKRIDYLSLDIDFGTLQVLRNLPLDRVRFSLITIEHDAYRFGEKVRADMIAILEAHRYTILCPAVCSEGCDFEIWAADMQLFWTHESLIKKYRQDGPTEWEDFFK